MYKTKEEPGETCFRIAAAEASSANLVVLVDVVRAGPRFVLVQVREVRDGADQRSLPSWLRQAQAQPAPYATLAHPGTSPRVRAMAAGKVSLLCAAPTLGRRVCMPPPLHTVSTTYYKELKTCTCLLLVALPFELNRSAGKVSLGPPTSSDQVRGVNAHGRAQPKRGAGGVATGRARSAGRRYACRLQGVSEPLQRARPSPAEWG